MKLSTVYGSLMHHRAELQALGDAAHQSPYNAMPKAPVLYIKPVNTFNAFGGNLHLPAAHAHITVRACVGLIYKPNELIAGINTARSATKNIVTEDWEFSLLCDFTLPHKSFYRPPLRFNALDGSLALPQHWMPWPAEASPSMPWPQRELDDLQVETWINGTCAQRYSTKDWTHSAQEQLAKASEFIAWEDGDVFMFGCPPDAPVARPGDVVEVRFLSSILTRTLIAQEAA